MLTKIKLDKNIKKIIPEFIHKLKDVIVLGEYYRFY